MTIPDAVLALARAAVPDVTVYDAIVPTRPDDRYAVLYIDNGTLGRLAVCSESDSATVRWQITSVAPDRQMASWIADTIRDALVDQSPSVPGWVCGLICHSFSESPHPDETVGEVPVVFTADRFDLLATRI